MHAPASIRALSLDADPLAMLASWPSDRPVVALVSRGPLNARSRWSYLAEPAAWWCAEDEPDDRGPDLAEELDRQLGAPRPGTPRAADEPPFSAGWMGMLGFELGRKLEPAFGTPPPHGRDGAWPLLALARCPGVLAHDRVTGRWFACGDVEPPDPLRTAARPTAFAAGPLRSSLTPEAYRTAARRVLEYIAAGDAFQVNLTQRLVAPFAGSRRALAVAALEASDVPYGAYLELPGERSLVSMSPELFLDLDADGAIATRPIKGTRPQQDDPAALAGSAKDAAELHMIVDLMRNDLGRVCAFGSVQVAQPRTIETHPSVHHGVAEVAGALRPGVTRGGVLRATFPPGSVTGAPKIRAVQIIQELEPVRRGPYCGAIGWFGEDGAMTLNVAIRTIMLARDMLAYGTGGGIVADSDPELEREECAVKTEMLRRVLARGGTIEPAAAAIETGSWPCRTGA